MPSDRVDLTLLVRDTLLPGLSPRSMDSELVCRLLVLRVSLLFQTPLAEGRERPEESLPASGPRPYRGLLGLPAESGVPGELALLLLALEPNNLLNVGEAISGYLDPGCLSPDCPDEVGLDLGEVDSPPMALSCSVIL